MKRTAVQNKRVAVLGMAFRIRIVFGTFQKRAPGHLTRLESKRFPNFPPFEHGNYDLNGNISVRQTKLLYPLHRIQVALVEK